jgi:hypothetical protein
VGQIEREEDMVDTNVVDTDDEEDDEHDYGAVDCNDWQVQNVDTGLHADLAEQRVQHALHSLRRGTSPLAGEYVSNAHQKLVAQDHQIDVATGHSKKSDVISDGLKS